MDGNTEAPAAKLPTLLEQMESATSIAEFDVVESGLAELESKFSKVVYEDINTKDGLARAKADRALVKEVRLKVAAQAKLMKDPLNKFKRVIDGQAERIIDRVEALEEPIDEQIKAEEKRLEEVKEAKRKAEAQRVESLDVKVRGIESFGHPAPGSTSEALTADRATLALIEPTVDEFQERTGDAIVARSTALKLLDAAIAAAKAAEAQVAELEAFRKEKAERDAREEVDRKAREKAEAEAEAERKRQAEIARKQQEEEANRQRLADAARLAAEQEKLEQDRAALAAQRKELDDLLAAARAKSALPVPVLDALEDVADAVAPHADSPTTNDADPGDEASPGVDRNLVDAEFIEPAQYSRDAVIDLVANSWFMTAHEAETLIVELFVLGGGK